MRIIFKISITFFFVIFWQNRKPFFILHFHVLPLVNIKEGSKRPLKLPYSFSRKFLCEWSCNLQLECWLHAWSKSHLLWSAFSTLAQRLYKRKSSHLYHFNLFTIITKLGDKSSLTEIHFGRWIEQYITAIYSRLKTT